MDNRKRVRIIKLPLVSYCGIEFNNRRWSNHLMKCNVCNHEHDVIVQNLINNWNFKCKCGCGEITLVGNKYINGHTATNIKRTEEQRLNYKAGWTTERRIEQSIKWKNNNPLFEQKNKKYGDDNPSKRNDVRKKISENNPMNNPEHKKKCVNKRKSVGYEKTILRLKGKQKCISSIEKQIKTYTKNLSEGKIKIKNNWKCGDYIKKDGNVEWFDSSYEKIRMKFFDDNNFVWTKRHGIRIPYINEKGLNSYYVPDFKIVDNLGVIIIEEVKGWIKENDVLKALAGIEYCKNNDLIYRFLLGEKLEKIKDLSYGSE